MEPSIVFSDNCFRIFFFFNSKNRRKQSLPFCPANIFWKRTQYIPVWTGRQHISVLDIQFSSVTQSYPTLCDPMDCSIPGFSVHHQLLGPTRTHAHRAVMPSNHLILWHPFHLLPSIFLSIRTCSMRQFFTSGGQSMEFQLQHQSLQWIFRTDFL